MGLIVAIPCTAIYTFLRNRIDALITEIGDIIERLTAHIEHHQSGAQPPAGAPARKAGQPAPPAAPRPQRAAPPSPQGGGG
jgi:hypothetical protein